MQQYISFSSNTISYLNSKERSLLTHLLNIPIANIKQIEKNGLIDYNALKSISQIDDPTLMEIANISKKLKADYNMIISESFIKDTVVDWLFNFKKENQYLCQYVENKLNGSIKQYRFAFPIYDARYFEGKLKKNITKDVTFETQSHPQFERLLYGNCSISKETIFACTTEIGELEIAKEVAFDRCSFAVDIFKTCSELSRNPVIKEWAFELNKGELQNDVYVYICWNVDDPETDKRTVNFSRRRMPATIDDKILNHTYQIDSFIQLYNDYYSESSNSLCNVLKNAIHKYSNAVSTIDIYERVVLFCSILDMLVLDKNKKGIIINLKKYIPILIENEVDKRQELSDFISKMYKVRSEYIHHAERIRVNWEDVYFLGFIVFTLMCKLLSIRNQFENLDEVYSDVEKQMNSIIYKTN